MFEQINIEGVCLALLVLLILGVQLAVNKWIRKVTNTYWFWLGLGAFYLIWCISISWWKYWYQLAYADIPWGTLLDTGQSRVASWGLLLNICPFVNFAISIALIVDPTRKAARAVAPLGMIGSFFVLFFCIPFDLNASFTLKYIFFGFSEIADLYFFGHTMNFLLGFGVLLNTPKFGWKGTISVYGLTLGFYIYTTIFTYISGCQYFCAGVRLTDFGPDGNFKFFDLMFPGKPQYSMALFFIGLACALFLIPILTDVCKRGYFNFGDKYSGCWWQWYDYEKTTIKEPWGWFSHNWQLKHPKNRMKLK